MDEVLKAHPPIKGRINVPHTPKYASLFLIPTRGPAHR